jgi:DNA-binding NarL/FixJ family response regulator
MSTPELRVLIVSTNPLARGGLAAMLEGMPRVKAVGSAGTADAASLAGQLLPDVVLLDVGDGELEDLDAIARLGAAQPGLPIVALAGEPGALAPALAFADGARLDEPANRQAPRDQRAHREVPRGCRARQDERAVASGGGRPGHRTRVDPRLATTLRLGKRNGS